MERESKTDRNLERELRAQRGRKRGVKKNGWKEL